MSAAFMLRERDAGLRRPRYSPERVLRGTGAPSRPLAAHSAETLDDLMTGAWAALRADAPIACPLCDSLMEPRWSAGAGVVGGRCTGCGSELA